MSTYCAEAQSGAKLPKERLLETLDFIFQRILPEQGYRLRHEQLALAQDIFTALERRSVLLSEAGVTADSDSWSPVSIAKKIFGSTAIIRA